MPVPPSSLTTIVDDSDPVLGELAAVPAAPAGLLQCLAKVTDPRKRRGVRHRSPRSSPSPWPRPWRAHRADSSERRNRGEFWAAD